MPLFLTFFLVTGKGQRAKPVSLLLHVRDIAIRLVGNLILQASPPTSWPQSSQPSHTSDPSSTSLVSPALGEKQRCPWDTPGRHGKWISDSFFCTEIITILSQISGRLKVAISLLSSCVLWNSLGCYWLQRDWSPISMFHTLWRYLVRTCFSGDQKWQFFFFPLHSDVTGTLRDRKRP